MSCVASVEERLYRLGIERALATRTPSSEEYFERAIADAIALLQPPAAVKVATRLQEQSQ